MLLIIDIIHYGLISAGIIIVIVCLSLYVIQRHRLNRIKPFDMNKSLKNI